MRTLLPHQKKIWGEIKDQKNLALFLEMRLGKTLLAIRWIKRKNPETALVICPASVIPVWEEELEKEGENYFVLHGQEALWVPDECRWGITNYENILANPQILEYGAKGISALILDESTKIKNPTAKTTKCLLDARKWFAYKAVLSGTPNPESLLELFMQMKFLSGEFLGYRNYWSFREDLFKCRDGYNWYPKPKTRRLISRELRHLAVFLKRKNVGIKTPHRTKRIYVSLPENLRDEYRSIEEEFAWDGEETVWRLAVDVWLARISGGRHKIQALIGTLRKLEGKKVVVWFRFNKELQWVYRILKRKEVNCDFITGETPKQERGARYKRFNTGQVCVLLCQIKCVQYGVDLHGADVSIRYSTNMSHENNEQAKQRVLHHTKEEVTQYIDIVTKDSIDEDMFNALENKKIRSNRELSYAIKNGFRKRIKS